jgi:hypothetical protein
MDADFQSEEEIAAHYGPEGPVMAAAEWLRCVLERNDLAEAWPLTDPNLRLVLTQEFLWANREHEALAGYDLTDTATSLASCDFEHELWPAFQESQVREFHEAWDEFFSGYYAVASRPRPVGVDYELVKYVETESDEPMWVTEPTLVVAQVYLMRATEGGWLMAGFGVDTPPTPGWPPTPGERAI